METEYVLQDMPPSGTTHTLTMYKLEVTRNCKVRWELKSHPGDLERQGLRMAESTAQGARGEERTSQEAHAGMLGKQVAAFSTHARTMETKSVRWG